MISFSKCVAFGRFVFREMVAALQQQSIPEILAKSCHPRRRARLSYPNNKEKIN